MSDTIRGLLIVPICWGFLKMLTISGLVESEKQTKKRLQDEADALAGMPAELRQLHMEADRKGADFKFSIAIFILTTIVSGSLIYWFLK